MKTLEYCMETEYYWIDESEIVWYSNICQIRIDKNGAIAYYFAWPKYESHKSSRPDGKNSEIWGRARHFDKTFAGLRKKILAREKVIIDSWQAIVNEKIKEGQQNGKVKN